MFSATPQTVSTIVANLERAGAIVRHPHHYHGRIQQIDLSETGKSLLGISGGAGELPPCAPTYPYILQDETLLFSSSPQLYVHSFTITT
ncbi:MAG: MarR family winged helix-turn-helix transcriptional regulator [Acidithiobacillus sp.]|nr:MarR family winged helix-turn-helix transcriptional regulator [Acidithiobacillus sp.]